MWNMNRPQTLNVFTEKVVQRMKCFRHRLQINFPGFYELFIFHLSSVETFTSFSHVLDNSVYQREAKYENVELYLFFGSGKTEQRVCAFCVNRMEVNVASGVDQ